MLRIGSGAGFAGDRLDPAVRLAEQGNLNYLVLECLAERTIALAQRRKLQNPATGYDSLLERRIAPLLPVIKKQRVRLITNMGAANPLAAADKIVELACQLQVPVKVAAVTGDDVADWIDPEQRVLESGKPISAYAPVISANAYLGAEALLPALESGADIIVTGRVADPSLFLAPMIHHYRWRLDDFTRLAQGTVVGHLLECAGQLTGGYFADPGVKDIPNMADLGFPYADVDEDGRATISKLEGTGGAITLATAREQLLYEVTDPLAYHTPDVIVDFSGIQLREVGPDRIEVFGARGREKPPTLKVSIGYRAGFRGEAEISYAGHNAQGRAELAGEIVRERLRQEVGEVRIDYIGSTSTHRKSFTPDVVPYEVRMRAAALTPTPELAARIGEEVEALYTNGPAGGGGVRRSVNEVIGIVSTLIPREKVATQVTIRELVP
ncbi:acyclic terpene utilization AtuA family protein [Brevibacillus marinus]|uniref:acyclic terpene utilization AtuA family protein n=1 Tax=Brevibacillus marinus TaxID=2496837 RepID=UPI000F8369F6|nr:acyclic terpene utilization AtuA family protein [Brevibacillus marinus]